MKDNHEPLAQKIISNKLSRGDVFIGIGSYIGKYSLLAAKKVGENGTVHSIEPDPVARQVLKENILNNDLDQIIKVHSLALSSRSGEIRINQRREFGDTRTTILPTDTGKSVKVRSEKLSEFIEERDIEPILIKIDVEGGEHEIICGSEEYVSLKNLPSIGIT